MERIVPVVTSVDQELCVWEHGAAVPTGTESEGEMNLESNLEPAAFFFFNDLPSRRGGFPCGFHLRKLHQTWEKTHFSMKYGRSTPKIA